MCMYFVVIVVVVVGVFLATQRGVWDLMFPDQGSNPHPLQWKHGVLTTGLPGKSHKCVLFCFCFWPRHVACGILVPQPRIEPVPPALGACSLNLWTAKEVVCV